MTRARLPDRVGVVDRDGVRVGWEAFGTGEPAIVFAPTWSIVDSQVWKLQVPDFARRSRVITIDPRGNGRSDRPKNAAAYDEAAFAADILAVMDASETPVAVLVSLSIGAQRALLAAAAQPERFAGLVFIAPAVPVGASHPVRPRVDFEAHDLADRGWSRFNRHSWRRDYRGFVEFFFEQAISEAHSTKPIEDCVGWGLETDAETLILTTEGRRLPDRAATLELAARVRCPVLVIQGDADRVQPVAQAEELAAATGAELVTIAGGGHLPNARDPVLVNLLIRDFIRTLPRAGHAGSGEGDAPGGPGASAHAGSAA
jgi:pimeloyl-ACP methyl ester carboxylesterase